MSIFGDAFDFLGDIGDDIADVFGEDFISDLASAGAKTLSGSSRRSSSSNSLFSGVPKYSDLDMPTQSLAKAGSVSPPKPNDYNDLYDFWMNRLYKFSNMKG